MTEEESRQGARAPGVRGKAAPGVKGEPSEDVDLVAAAVLRAAVEVHRELGPGLLEAVYEEALCIELDERKIPFERQVAVPVRYKGRPIGNYRLDLLVASKLIIELKAIDSVLAVHQAQAMSYLRATGLELALIINFNTPLLLRGVHRVVLTRPR